MPAVENINIVALVVALLGVGGIGVFFREIVGIITLIRNGTSAKESKRKNDLVAQRDREYRRAEGEARNRRRLEEYASRLIRILIQNGLESLVPQWPTLEETFVDTPLEAIAPTPPTSTAQETP